jgi:hypothetical protein
MWSLRARRAHGQAESLPSRSPVPARRGTRVLARERHPLPPSTDREGILPSLAGAPTHRNRLVVVTRFAIAGTASRTIGFRGEPRARRAEGWGGAVVEQGVRYNRALVEFERSTPWISGSPKSS